MKKYFIAVLLVLFATAAYAEVKFEVSGNFHARGQYWSHEAYSIPGTNLGFGAPIMNMPGLDTDTVTWGVYDGDLNLYPKIIVDNTTLTMKLAIQDQIWDDPMGERHTTVDSTAPFTDSNGDGSLDSAAVSSTEYDDDDIIKVERLYITHNFANGIMLDVGLMDGAVWGTTFAETVTGKYRVRLIHTKTPIGAIGAVIEKNKESSSPYIKDSNKDDNDSYGLFMVTKAGDIFIKPLIFYVHNSASVPTLSSDGLNVLYLALELSGDLGGGLGFESEFGWKQYEWEDYQKLGLVTAKDSDLYGAYLNVWKNFDAAKVGAILTYGNWDDKGGPTGAGQGWDYGDDFESNLILGDWVAWGDTPGDPASATDPNALGHDLTGMNMIKLYASDIQTPVDKLSVKGSFAYIMSNQKDTALYQATYGIPNVYDGASAWEIDLGGAYAFTDNLVYSFQAGYADCSYDVDGFSDPDPIMLLEHKIQFTF